MEKPTKWRKRVEVFITNGEGKVLLAKNKTKHNTIPGGGIETGETLIQTAEREVLEEVGVEITNIKQIDIPDYHDDFYDEPDNTKIHKDKDGYRGSITKFLSAEFVKENKELWNHSEDAMKYIWMNVKKSQQYFKQQSKKKELPKGVANRLSQRVIALSKLQ